MDGISFSNQTIVNLSDKIIAKLRQAKAITANLHLNFEQTEINLNERMIQEILGAIEAYIEDVHNLHKQLLKELP